MNINELNVKTEIKTALQEMGIETLTEIQERAIPLLLEGKDVIGQAMTGTGKTAAFAIPILNDSDPQNGQIEHLVLAPTRELASQITHEFEKIGKYLDITIVEVIGGVPYERQRKQLKSKPNIVVATPGRIIDHLKNYKLDISHIKTCILDEADEMLNVGFKKELDEIATYLPENRINCLFSATLNDKVNNIAKKILTNPVKIEISTGLTAAEKVSQQYIVIKEAQKFKALRNFLDLNLNAKVIVFGRSKRRVGELCDGLVAYGYKAKAIHGDMSQDERTQSLNSFKKGNINILVATDVAARGIHIDAIDLVFNFDLPAEIEYYVHRIGRSGRGDAIAGKSISFVRKEELNHLDAIRAKTKSTVVQVTVPTAEEIKVGKKAKLIEDITALIDEDEIKAFGLTEELLEIFDEKTLVSALISLLNAKKVSEKVTLTPEPPVRSKTGRNQHSEQRRNRQRRSGGDRPRRNGGDGERRNGGDRSRRSGGERKRRN